MFIATNHPSKTLRSVRSEMCFQVAGAPVCCAPTEREPNSVTSGLNMSPRWGEIRQHQLVAFKLEFAFTN